MLAPPVNQMCKLLILRRASGEGEGIPSFTFHSLSHARLRERHCSSLKRSQISFKKQGEGNDDSLLNLELEKGDAEDGVKEDFHQSCPAGHINTVYVKRLVELRHELVKNDCQIQFWPPHADEALMCELL